MVGLEIAGNSRFAQKMLFQCVLGLTWDMAETPDLQEEDMDHSATLGSLGVYGVYTY